MAGATHEGRTTEEKQCGRGNQDHLGTGWVRDGTEARESSRIGEPRATTEVERKSWSSACRHHSEQENGWGQLSECKYRRAEDRRQVSPGALQNLEGAKSQGCLSGTEQEQGELGGNEVGVMPARLGEQVHTEEDHAPPLVLERWKPS